MKKTLLIFCIAIAILPSCMDNLEINNPKVAVDPSMKQGIETDICNYICSPNLRKSENRAVVSDLLIPYVYKGDTVMYVVNYEDGWDLFSTDHRVPMIIASSSEGRFDINAMSPSLKTYINSVANELYQIKETGKKEGTTYGLWNIVSVQNSEVDKKEVDVVPHAQGTQPGEDGYWVLLDRSAPVNTVYTSPKLTSTKWGQSFPWNVFIPYSVDKNYNTVQGPAGCESVAVGQFLYYTHYKDNRPSNTVTTATYDALNNKYVYSGSTASAWDGMAKDRYDTGTDKTAVFIGYIGQLLNTEYTSTYGEAYFKDAANLINRLGNFNYSVQTNMDYDYIRKQLASGRIVYARADDASGKGGHAFIIDRYQTITTTSISTYGWVGKDTNGNDTNEYDEEGNIIGYAFTYERENKVVSVNFMMNWGWNGSGDKTACDATNHSNWYVDEYNFKDRRYFLK